MNPAELSRPAVGLTTPVLSHKSITVGASSLQKTPKVSNAVPARIDLEPVYAALKAAIGSELWPVYKETTSQFLVGTSVASRLLAILAMHRPSAPAFYY